MSIKSELRLIEQKQIEILNTNFTSNVNYWENTGNTTQWTMSEWENTSRSSSGDSSMLYQPITEDLPLNKKYVLEYQVIRNSGDTITPYFSGTSGTTRYTNGKYSEVIDGIPVGFSGNSWTEVESIRNWFDVDLSSDGSRQVAGTNNSIYLSDDYGQTWTQTGATDEHVAVSMSSNGQYITSVSHTLVGGLGLLYVSDDYGLSWSIRSITQDWRDVSISTSGQYQLAVGRTPGGSNPGYMYVSSDYGLTWTQKPTWKNFDHCAVSDDGLYQLSCAADELYLSTTSGNSFSLIDSGTVVYQGMEISGDGKYMTCTTSGPGQIRVSDDYGATFTVVGPSKNWEDVTMSSDGRIQIAYTENADYLYISNDYGQTWEASTTDIVGDPTRNFSSVSLSKDGTRTTASIYGGKLYISSTTSKFSLGIGFIPSSGFTGGLTNMRMYYYDYDEYGIQLYDDVSYNLNFAIFDIDDIDNRSSTYSKTISIPGTAYNNNIFSHLYDIDVELNKTLAITNTIKETFFNKRIDCELWYDTIPIKEGFFELQGVKYNEDLRQIEYEGVFYSKAKTFAENVGDKLLTGNKSIADDLDFSMYDHDLLAENVFNSQLFSGYYYTNSKGYYYPIIDYFNMEENIMEMEHLRPGLYLKEIIDKIFEDANFTYSSTFFDSDFFKTLILPWTGKVELDTEELQLRDFNVTTSDFFTGYGPVIWGNSGWYEFRDLWSLSLQSFEIPNQPTTRKLPFDTDSPDPWYNSAGEDFNTTTNTWTVPNRGEYVLDLTSTQQIYGIRWGEGQGLPGFVFNSGDRSVGVYYSIWKRPFGSLEPVLLKQIEHKQYFAQVAGDTWTAPWTSLLTYKDTYDAGDEVWASISIHNYNIWYNGAGVPDSVITWLYVHPDQTVLKATGAGSYQLFEGELVEMGRCLPTQTKQMDFFKGIINMFNLIVDESPTLSNTLIIENRDDYYLSGTTQDWTDYEDLHSGTEISRIETLIDKDFVMSYREDSDTFNKIYTEEEVPGRIYGDHIVKNPYKSSDTYNVESDFSPTLLGNFGTTNWVVSKMYELNEREEVIERTFNPRILQRYNIPYLVDGYGPLSVVHVIGKTGITYGYGGPIDDNQIYQGGFQPYAGHLNNPYDPTKDVNFYYCDKYLYDLDFKEDGYQFHITDNNIYQNYWKDYVAELMDVNSKKVVKNINLNIQQINSLDFANPILIDGVIYTLNKINDWNPEQITEVELLKLSKFDLDNSVPPYKSSMVGKRSKPVRKNTNIFEAKPSYSLSLISFSGSTQVSGASSTDYSGTTIINYTKPRNYYDANGYGIIVGEGNVINTKEFFVNGDNNFIQSGNSYLSIMGSNVSIRNTGITNVTLIGDFSGQTLDNISSNKVYLGTGTTIDGYYTKGETDSIVSGVTSSGVSLSYLQTNYYDTGETYSTTQSDLTYAQKDGGFTRFAKTGNTHITGDEYIIGDQYAGVAIRSVTLKTAKTLSGKVYIIQDEVGNASSFNITVNCQGGQNINGAASASISTNYGSITVYSDGSNWFTAATK